MFGNSEMSEMYLGIDQSFRSTGLCLADENGKVLHDHLIRIDPDKDEEIMEYVELGEFKDLDKSWQKIILARRVRTLVAEWYRQLLDTLPSDVLLHVNIEGLGFGSVGDNTRSLAGLQFLMIDSLLTINDNYACYVTPSIEVIPPTTLKKFATGNGKADKNGMFDSLPEETKERYTKVLKTKGRSDLTDAYWLSMWGYRNRKKKDET